MISLAELLRRFPGISWAAPVLVKTAGSEEEPRLACRICIAQVGLTPEKISKSPKTTEEFVAHMAAVHGLTPKQPTPVAAGPHEAAAWAECLRERAHELSQEIVAKALRDARVDPGEAN